MDLRFGCVASCRFPQLCVLLSPDVGPYVAFSNTVLCSGEGVAVGLFAVP